MSPMGHPVNNHVCLAMHMWNLHSPVPKHSLNPLQNITIKQIDIFQIVVFNLDTKMPQTPSMLQSCQDRPNLRGQHQATPKLLEKVGQLGSWRVSKNPSTTRWKTTIKHKHVYIIYFTYPLGGGLHLRREVGVGKRTDAPYIRPVCINLHWQRTGPVCSTSYMNQINKLSFVRNRNRVPLLLIKNTIILSLPNRLNSNLRIGFSSEEDPFQGSLQSIDAVTPKRNPKAY